MTGTAAASRRLPAGLAGGTGEAPRRQAFPIILSAPSGAGKTSVARALLKRFPELEFVVSCTTRACREGEVRGRDYDFMSEEKFLARADAGDFVEWARVHGHYYGTPRAHIDAALSNGRHVLLDVDVQGAKSLISEYPFAVSVFLLPPSLSHMAQRLHARGTEGESDLSARLEQAVQEIPQAKYYHYVLVNEDLKETIDLFEHILRAEEQRRSRIANWKSWIEAAYGAASRGGKRA